MPETTQSDQKDAALKLAGNTPSNKGLFHFSVAYFLVALVLMVVTSPFILQLYSGDFIESILITLVFIFAVLATGGSRRSLVWAIVLVIPVVAGKWVNRLRPDLMPPEVYIVAALVFFVFLTVHYLSFILRAPRVNSEVLCAGVATYLVLGILWSFAYILVAELVPDSFAFTTGPISTHSMKEFVPLYFSYVTLTTVGYGDIIPVSGAARMLAMTEAMVGMFYVTLLIARLVALYYSKGPTDVGSNQVRPERNKLE
jgi:ion channel